MIRLVLLCSDIYIEQTSSHGSKDSRYVNVDEKDEMIHQLQSQLEKQKRKQFRQERVSTLGI